MWERIALEISSGALSDISSSSSGDTISFVGLSVSLDLSAGGFGGHGSIGMPVGPLECSIGMPFGFGLLSKGCGWSDGFPASANASDVI